MTVPMKTIDEAIVDGDVADVEGHYYHEIDGYVVVFIGGGWMCNNFECDEEWEVSE